MNTLKFLRLEGNDLPLPAYATPGAAGMDLRACLPGGPVEIPPGKRPALVVGFAAETDDVIANATAKRARKGCDWIVANDVRPETGIMGGSENAVTLITGEGAEEWPRASKAEVARRLADRIADALYREGMA